MQRDAAVAAMIRGIGASDCELLRDELLAQPVNAVTSLAYVVVGIVIVAVAVSHHRPLAQSLVYGVCLAGVGVGSVLFHGPQPAGSRLLHDLPILVTVIFIVVHEIARRRRRRPVETRRQRQAYLALAVVAALAAVTWLLGRTGSPACDPGAAFQFHGLWHVISSLVLGLWWWLAYDSETTGDRAS